MSRSYDVVGEGRPLMLLHGLWCDRSRWIESGYVDELQRDRRLLNVDIRGHGASDKPHDPAAYSRKTLVGDVLAVANAEGWVSSRLGPLLRRVDRMDDRGRRSGTGPGDH